MSKNKCTIYLCGGMSGLSDEEQTVWRTVIPQRIKKSGFELTLEPTYFNPVVYDNHFKKEWKSDREYFEFDMNALRNSDLVAVNFNSPGSTRMAMELAIAYENRIPVIGLNENGYDLHPWLKECTMRICDDIDELIEYLLWFFLI